MSPHTVLLCDTGHYSPYYSQPFTTLITWKILRSNCLWGCTEKKHTHTHIHTQKHWRVYVSSLACEPLPVRDGTMHTDNSNISKKMKDKYTKSGVLVGFLLCFVSNDAHWTPAASQHAIRTSVDQCGRSSAGWEGRGAGGGQTAPHQLEAAVNWRFAMAEEEGIRLGNFL